MIQASWLRKQSGQAVVVVAAAILLLTAILMLALDGGGIYLDKRQLQNAADAAALAGAEKLMAVNPSYPAIHGQAVANLVKNLPSTALPASCSPCPNQMTLGAPGGDGVGTLNLGSGYWAELSVLTSYTYQVSVWHVHQNVVAPLHGFSQTITLSARATAQNADLPYAIILLQDSYQASYADLQLNGSPSNLVLKRAASVTGDKGGAFSNASISAGNGSVLFSPCAQAGDLWAYQESASDAVTVQSRVNGSQAGGPGSCLEPPGTYPLVPANKIIDPSYPEPPVSAAVYGAINNTSGTMYLCPGTYNGSINNQGTIILMPGVYRINGSVTLSGNSGSSFSSASASTTFPPPEEATTNCPATPARPADGDYGVIIEMVPSSAGGPSCNTNQFSLTGQQTITLSSSPKFDNINLYVEKIASNWTSICSATPYGSHVVNIAGQASYSIRGALYGPADNMTIAGNGATAGVGQVVAWTLTVSGNGSLTETYDPAYLPYLKGLVQ